MNSSDLFDNATNTEKEVANILLELPRLFIEPIVPKRRFRVRRSVLKESPSLPIEDHSVASQLETPTCNGENENENSNRDTDDQRIPYIEENSSEIKVQSASLEPTTSQHKVIKIKFNPPSEIHYSQKQIQIEDKPPKLKADIHPKGLMIINKTCNERAKDEIEEGLGKSVVPKGHLLRGSGKIKAETSTVPEASKVFVPSKKRDKRKSIEELKKELALLEQRKRGLLKVLESKENVKEHLEKRKALKLQQKALKLQEAKP
ncbi:PREDICTED: uncharacterized protein LOC18604134 [Theobroma cacao]|uniref:Uncharacterized protein LOC18604134 n=1 Tax=Theobroma cacao TaxID=3641 RepID=A0AB32V910_THECC|nr:PREDICTED: uncharacterized protein LOC18604134 [Theobroma cacao]